MAWIANEGDGDVLSASKEYPDGSIATVSMSDYGFCCRYAPATGDPVPGGDFFGTIEDAFDELLWLMGGSGSPQVLNVAEEKDEIFSVL